MVAHEEFAAVKAEIERRDRQSSRRAILLTAIPVLVAGLLLSVTFLQVREARRQAAEAQRKVEEMTKVLNSVEDRLRESTEFRRHVRQLNWETVKIIASRYPHQGMLLFDIVDSQGEVKWKLGGTSPSEGFDSPGFAAYLLNKRGLLKTTASQRYQLRELVESAVTPEVGDLAFYETGYTMFYFKDDKNRPFCIGMTPAGIIAVDPNFGPTLVAYGRIRYRR